MKTIKSNIFLNRRLWLGSACLAGALTLTGCSESFLEEPLRGQQTIENYYTSEEEVEQQVTGCYQTLAFDDWW